MIAGLPASSYGSPAGFAAERAAVHRRAFHLIAHDSELAQAGDYVAGEIAGCPVILVRGTDGMVRGFHDVCRHRGGPLSAGERGHCGARLVCRYHGWAYDLDGRLHAARDFGAAPDPAAYSLVPVETVCWRGFHFVRIEPGETTLADLMAPVEARLPNTMAPLHAVLRTRHEIACDWKLYAENYLEGYHIARIHPALAAEIDSARYRVELDHAAAFFSAPVRGGAASAGLWAFVWPWLGLNIYEGGMMAERIVPLGPRRTRLDYLWLTADGAPPADAALNLSAATTAEDIAMCEAVQARLSGGAVERFVLSPRHETAIAAFHAQLRAALAGRAPARSGASDLPVL